MNYYDTIRFYSYKYYNNKWYKQLGIWFTVCDMERFDKNQIVLGFGFEYAMFPEKYKNNKNVAIVKLTCKARGGDIGFY